MCGRQSTLSTLFSFTPVAQLGRVYVCPREMTAEPISSGYAVTGNSTSHKRRYLLGGGAY